MAAALTDSGELTYLSFGIEKVESTPDGDLMVYGKASDGSVDSDQQIVDPGWMSKAIQDWLSTGANLRVQHNPQRDPAGVGLTASTDDAGATWVKSLVVEPVAQKLVSKGALRAYSVGIAHPTIERDAHARGGRITGGTLVELSLVDRPANKSCGIQLVKSADDGTAEYTGTVFGADDVIAKMLHVSDAQQDGGHSSFASLAPADMSIEFTPADLAKILQSKIIDRHYDELAVKALRAEEAQLLGKDHREFSEEQRRQHASEGNALPDGSYPVPDKDALRRAAVLARSKHGNYEAASRLIARRARELGVPNPMDSDSGNSEKGEGVTDAVTPADGAAKEAEAVITKDPADQPEKKSPGKKKGGKKMPPWLNDSDADDAKSASPDLTAQADGGAGKCSTDPKTASGAKDAADMKPIPHPDSLQESPMPAGRKTPDTKGIGMSPEASAMLRFKSIGIDPDLGRLHDLSCPAYNPDEVVKYHPFADFATLIDEDVWMRKAVDAASGPVERAVEMTRVWEAAQALKHADEADLNDYRRELHKAFRDANPGPSSYPSPGVMSPRQYCRPCITDGHAANSPGHEGPNTSPQVAASAPSASHFDRPPLSAGHQSPSPSFMKGGWEYPSQQGVPTRLRYAQDERENARRALSVMHDHLNHMFPSACPILDQDPYRQPEAGAAVPAVKSADAEVAKAPEQPGEDFTAKAQKKMRKKLGKKVLSGKMTVDEARAKLGRNVTQKAEPADIAKGIRSIAEIRAGMEENPLSPLISPEIIKNAVAEAIAPLTAKVEEQQQLIAKQDKQISEQEARWEAAADSPDPKTTPFSGLALNPVFKSARPAGVTARAEIAERTQQMIRRQLHHTWRTSENPAEREAAYAELSKYGFTE